jgi:nucleotide-binding universal stress UspA family protein
MYKHILVTLDGTARSEAVMPHASAVARAMGAELTLLRVVDPLSAEWGERGAVGKAPADSPMGRVLIEQAQEYLDRVAEQSAAQGVRPRTMVRQGHPAREIIQTARELDADAIAMATRSRRGIGRLMFGSVAGEVIHEAGVPVILVKA